MAVLTVHELGHLKDQSRSHPLPDFLLPHPKKSWAVSQFPVKPPPREAGTPLLVETDPPRLREVLAAAEADGVDLAVIDTRPSAAEDAALVARLSDVILIPTQPAIFDLRAILGTIDTAKGAVRRSMIVLNRCEPQRGVGEATETGDARRAAAAFGVGVAAVAIVDRTTIRRAPMTGQIANEAEPDGKAAREMTALWRLIEKELSHEKAHAGHRGGEEAGRGVVAGARAASGQG
jgi:chromosome partitioning protein